MQEEMPIKMLKNDHRKVEELIGECKATDDPEEQVEIVKKIAKELMVHMEVEEQLFYPKVSEFSEEGEQMVKHSKQEHDEMRHIVMDLKDIEEMNEKVSEDLKRLEMLKSDHVREEEQKMFPFAEKNLEEELGLGLSAKMLALKQKVKMQQ